MKVVAIIPSRYGATRFPGKPLALLRGKPMIQHVYERASEVRVLDRIIVATDDERIAEVIRNINGEIAMIHSNYPTGTDALAQVAQEVEAEIVVNIQGDLPVFYPAIIEDAVSILVRSPHAVMSTVKTPIYKWAQWHNPNVVKIVTDREEYAIYFSRSPIPFNRDLCSLSRKGNSETILGYRHIGLYVYRKDFLLSFITLPQTSLEQIERLEQLRVLESGYRIVVSNTEHGTMEIDTPKDLQKAERILKKREMSC